MWPENIRPVRSLGPYCSAVRWLFVSFDTCQAVRNCLGVEPRSEGFGLQHSRWGPSCAVEGSGSHPQVLLGWNQLSRVATLITSISLRFRYHHVPKGFGSRTQPCYVWWCGEVGLPWARALPHCIFHHGCLPYTLLPGWGNSWHVVIGSSFLLQHIVTTHHIFGFLIEDTLWPWWIILNHPAPGFQVLGIDMKYRGGYSWGGVNMGEPADETVTVADSPATCKEPMSVVRYWYTWCVQRNPIVFLVIYDHIYSFQYTWKLNLTFADAQILPGLQAKPLPFSFPPTHEERHQWLELTLRPSLQTYVCDLWVADAVGNDALRWSIVEEGFCLGSIFSYSCWNFHKWQRQEERQALSKSHCWTLGRLIKIGSIPTGASTLANKFVQKNQVMSSCQIFEFRVPSINWDQMIFW